MIDRQRFPYLIVRNVRGEVVSRPMLPLNLRYHNQHRDVAGLLDTGADVNVLPYRLGLELGAEWDDQQTILELSGNLANYEARGIVVEAVVGKCPPVRLAFAWTRAEDVPLIFGQMNFFMEFDVCFFRSRSLFEIAIKSG